MTQDSSKELTRRSFLKAVAGGAACVALDPLLRTGQAADLAVGSDVYWVRNIPALPFASGDNRHAGVDGLLGLMGENGLAFHRSPSSGPDSGPGGLIAADDVVLVKVNAQWKYRGATNSDVVRGLIQAVLDHPDGFSGEVVIVENGQGRGSLNCDTANSYGNHSVQANANDRTHSFTFLVDQVFRDSRVSTYLLDPIRRVFIDPDDHITDGYRRAGKVSYPCFTTRGGRRVELREGVWDGVAHAQNLKLLNVPVLKHHDVGGSEITAALKHCYGLLSMKDGYKGERHYGGLGAACGDMYGSVRAPVLSIVDAIWVSHRSLNGYPARNTRRVNQLMASLDPVALDYQAALQILHPIDANHRHHPRFPGIAKWLTAARDRINGLGGLADPVARPLQGPVTCDEAAIRLHELAL